MNRRMVVVGCAALIAGLVLTASLVFGPPMMSDEPSQTSSDIGAAASNQARDVTYTILQRGESDDDITRTVLRADRLQRLDRGVSRLTRPRAEMRYSPTRAMTLSADSADVIMVDNQPQRGTFAGNVVITLFEAQPGETLVTDSADPDHEKFVRLKVFLDEQTDFDLATNDIGTNGPVHVTARETDFFGQGLRLKYNTVRKRIEQLVITEGRYLMFNPAAETRSSEDDEESEEDANEEDAAPSQYYLASFREQVLVREGDRAELFGDDKLEFRFSLGQEAITPAAPLTPDEVDQSSSLNVFGQSADPANPVELSAAIPNWQLAQAQDATATDSPAALLPQPGTDDSEAVDDPAVGVGDQEGQDDEPTLPVELVQPVEPALPGTLAQPVTIPANNLARSMFEHEPGRDVVVTWSGQLRLTPLSEKPNALIDDKDVQVHLQGENAYAQTTRDDRTDRIEAGVIEYLLGAQLINALAPRDKPIRITSSTLGSLEGTWLTLNQKTGRGTILGPGTITQLPDDQGQSLSLNWSDRLELQLYTEAEPGPPEQEQAEQAKKQDIDQPYARPGQMRVVGLQSARFLGDVSATHPDFDLKTQQLDLAFREPNENSGQGNDPHKIVATGEAVVMARGDDEDEQFAISAQSLTLGLATDETGELYATDLRALLDVRIERPGSVLTARRTDVAFAPPDRSAKPADDTEDAPAYAEVRSLVATGGVAAQLDYDGRRVDLSADQLVADVEQDQLTLIADDPRNLAEVYDVDDDRRLSGQLIVMDDQAEQVRVSGPGALVAALEDPDLDSARLAVTWERAMRFNNIESTAHFEGAVNATSLRSTDQTELSANQLDLRFSPDPDHDPLRLLPGEPEAGDAGDDAEKNREIRSTVAQGDVVLIASAFETNQPNKPYNRVRIEGPELVFTNRPQTSPTRMAEESLVVSGAGVMLIEDYRSRDQPDGEADDSAVSFTGRGATAFTWETRMSLDARTNTAVFIDQVQMIHRPRDAQDRNGEPVELYSQKLVADMEDGGGLGVWMSDSAPDAAITTVNAERDVRLLRQGKELLGDLLEYTAAKQIAELSADAGKQVIINDRETGTSARAERAIWDLAKDRIELRGAVGGSAPAQ